MKKVIRLFEILLFLLLILCCNKGYRNSALTEKTKQKPLYIKTYTDFLLNINYNVDEYSADFPILGYYLFDLNFDSIPELGILHDSGGSIGGYFTYYRFDGNKIVPILDDKDNPVYTSSYTQILSDLENKKVYFFKEMYLLQGNSNGTYGYIQEIRNENGRPYVHDILKLDVNQESDFNRYLEKDYDYEDDYLSDIELENCFITQYYSGKNWKEISSYEYLDLKRKLIPENNGFIDLLDTNTSILGSTSELIDEKEQYKNILFTADEIDMLFLKWTDYVKLGAS